MRTFLNRIYLKIFITAILFSKAFMTAGHCIENSMVNYNINGNDGQALVYRPDGPEPFPVVVYNHGGIVDFQGYEAAKERGYDMDGICKTLSSEGFLVFAPIRKGGRGNYAVHKETISQAIDYVKTLPDADVSRIAIMGFSRGAGLTLSVATKRGDLKAVIIIAIGTWGEFYRNLQDVPAIDAPVLLLVALDDGPEMLEACNILEQTLRENRKDVHTIRYDSGGHRLFWKPGSYLVDIKYFLLEKMEEEKTETE